jgi:hypothetical protein
MPRSKATKRGHALSILLATGAGFLIGSWNAAALHRTESPASPTAAQTVALRFPRALSEAPVVQATSYRPPFAAGSMATADAQNALFAPEPLIAPPPSEQAALPPAPQRVASLAPIAPVRQASVAAPILPRSKEPNVAARRRPELARRQGERGGVMLDDTQIASIKRRLHLTPEQEQMWPAVETALRNIAFARAREARRGDASAAIDPNSPEVQDLKSAAIPLLMSFSDQQKDEVRNVAHSMGLDQLTSEF